MDGQEVDPRLHKYAQHSTLESQAASDICDIRRQSDCFEVLICWEGLPDSADQTWEPLKKVNEDLQGILAVFFETAGKRELKRAAAALLHKWPTEYDHGALWHFRDLPFVRVTFTGANSH